MNRVFLDTAGLVAAWDKSDQWHRPARDAYERIDEDASAGVTTSYVLLECGNSAARRPYRDAVARLRENLEASGFLIHPTDEDWRQGWAAFRRGEAGGAGIVDQVSFAVMRRMNISRVFTHDQHFRAAGFETLF